MNIFILDENKRKSVEYHTDKHIIKMPLEATQLLCNAYYYTQESGKYSDFIYKPTHLKHQCSSWVSESLSNWLWLQDYIILIGYEYTYRYGKLHRSVQLAKVLPKPDLKDRGLTEFKLCMPEDVKIPKDVVGSYRNYFIKYKQHLKQYTKRSIPDWFIDA